MCLISPISGKKNVEVRYVPLQKAKSERDQKNMETSGRNEVILQITSSLCPNIIPDPDPAFQKVPDRSGTTCCNMYFFQQSFAKTKVTGTD
jgi:hypothetical protein